MVHGWVVRIKIFACHKCSLHQGDDSMPKVEVPLSSDTQPCHCHFKWFFFFYHLFFQHPYIYPPSFTTCNSEGIITVRNFLMNGTLRDFLCNVSRFHFWIFTSLGNHFILASSYTMRFRALCVSFTSSPLGSGLTLYFSRFDINSSTFIVTNTDVLFLSEYFSESFAWLLIFFLNNITKKDFHQAPSL